VLLCCDEVICAFGRLGHWFGSERLGFKPDLITFAKGVTSGYQPLGGVLVGRRVRAPFWDEDVPGAVFRHGYTYSGHAGAAAAAMANLDILEGEELVARVAALEPVLDAAVRRLATAPGVGEIRTVGLTAAVAFQPDLLTADPGLPERTVTAALNHGVATRVLRGHALQISPPFVITEMEIDTMVEGLAAALADVAPG
jgi:adenosylmethionine-8-amino-7-oxononanoate aminotransferase